MEIYEERQKWFQDRIGKRVYRGEVSCKCLSCTENGLDGIVISDEEHAYYLNDISFELNVEYRDNPLKEE